MLTQKIISSLGILLITSIIFIGTIYLVDPRIKTFKMDNKEAKFYEGRIMHWFSQGWNIRDATYYSRAEVIRSRGEEPRGDKWLSQL